MSEIATDRMRKVKSILVTQEAPADSNSPYLKLSEKFNLKIDFRPFIQVEAVPVKEFRKQKIDILNHTAIIFTSRAARSSLMQPAYSGSRLAMLGSFNRRWVTKSRG